jgi:hypothetical protein
MDARLNQPKMSHSTIPGYVVLAGDSPSLH